MSHTSSKDSAASTPDVSRTLPRGGICPYCGDVSMSDVRCDKCNGPLDALSRQATQNDMGPWFIRDEAQPFRPGCSFSRVREMTLKGRIGPATVLRGPSTRQFWMPARRVPGVANLLGVCHSCQQPVRAEDSACPHCHAEFRPPQDRQSLGIAPAHFIPGRPAPEAAASTQNVPSGSEIASSGSALSAVDTDGSSPLTAEEWAASSRRRGMLACVLAIALAGTIVVGVLAVADIVYDFGLGVRARVVGSASGTVPTAVGTLPSATQTKKGVIAPPQAMEPSVAPASVSSPAATTSERNEYGGLDQNPPKRDPESRPANEDGTPPGPRSDGGTKANTLRTESMEPGGPGSASSQSGTPVWDPRTFRGLR
jgi:hypothetical protein